MSDPKSLSCANCKNTTDQCYGCGHADPKTAGCGNIVCKSCLQKRGNK